MKLWVICPECGYKWEMIWNLNSPLPECPECESICQPLDYYEERKKEPFPPFR